MRKFGLTTDEVTIHTIGGSQTERYQAMVGNVVQTIFVTSPLDVRAKRDGFNDPLSSLLASQIISS